MTSNYSSGSSDYDLVSSCCELTPQQLLLLSPQQKAQLWNSLPQAETDTEQGILTQQRIDIESSLYQFVQAAWPHIESAEYVDSWHIQAICEHLQAVTNNQISNLLINIPPGCSKSLLVSVFWPMWEWTKNPAIRWFFASYDQRLSTRDSVKCRALIRSSWYQSMWGDKYELVLDQNQKTYFETSKGGYRLATSVGGHGTGEHPDRIVVDDPHNVQQAESEAERKSILDWWDLTMTTRGVSRDARRVIIMQRLHHEDLAGHLLEKGNYVHICLPMRYEKDRMSITPLGWTDPRTTEGQLLTPNQFTEQRVAEQEKSLGAYGTAGQLQQNPTPKEGAMFRVEWFNQRVKAAPYQAKRIRYWDRAATEGAGCWTAGVLLAKDIEGNYFVENVVRGQWEPDRRNEMMKATALADRLRYGPSQEPVIWVEREGGSSGRDAWKGVARCLAGFPVREDTVTGKKEVRAEPWACQLAAKNVHMVSDGTWDINAYVVEHCQFPLGKYLDQVDASSGAFNLLTGYKTSGYLHSFTLGRPLKPGLRILLCGPEELASLITEQRSVLISIHNPLCPFEEVMHNGTVSERIGGNQPGDCQAPGTNTRSGQDTSTADVNGDSKEVVNGSETTRFSTNHDGAGSTAQTSPPLPAHGLSHLIGSVPLSFADIQPSEVQDTWTEPLNGYGVRAEQVLFTTQMGKSVWSRILKKIDPPLELILIQDQGEEDRRAEAIALAVCDLLNLPRDKTLYWPREPERQSKREDKAKNQYVYEQMRTARSMVI